MGALRDEIAALRQEVSALRNDLQRLAGARVQVVGGLSDISGTLGLVTAGELRAGNGVAPGSGFTGVRIGYPPFLYGGELYNIVGVNSDALQFALRATDGRGVFGGGDMMLDADGAHLEVENSVGGAATNKGRIRWWPGPLPSSVGARGQIVTAQDSTELRLTVLGGSSAIAATLPVKVALRAWRADGIPTAWVNVDKGFLLDLLRLNLTGSGSNQTKTISGGVITLAALDQSVQQVDTEASAATDDLDTINGGNPGDLLILRANNDARTVVAKDGTGNLKLAGDFSLDNIEDTLTLIFHNDGVNSYWTEIARSNNGA